MTDLVRLQLEVEAIIRARTDIDAVDAMLNSQPISREEGAALWLYAWSLLPRRMQLKEARWHLARLQVAHD